MTEEELTQFIEAVIQASRFSPLATTDLQDKWRSTIINQAGGIEKLRAAMEQVEKERAA